MRYTADGTIFFRRDSTHVAWAIQINTYRGAGAPFKTLKWATWYNEHYILSAQETNEDVNLYGWEIASEVDLVLFGSQQIVDKLEEIKQIVKLGYTGKHSCNEKVIKEEWIRNR